MNNIKHIAVVLSVVMLFSMLSISSPYIVFNVRAGDVTPPTITINFAGNLSDSGGPYWRPPGESDKLDEVGEGNWRDGYYTTDSRQSEDWMYINLSVEDTEYLWFGVDSSNLNSFCGNDNINLLSDALDGTDYWGHDVTEEHWFILDLGDNYTICRLRGRSDRSDDPTLVDVYISTDNATWGTPVASNIATWQNTILWQEVDSTEKYGRYIRVNVTDTEDVNDYIQWGTYPAVTIFDVAYNVTHSDVSSPIYFQWLNETTWTNWTYQFVNTGGNYWEYNTSGNIQTCEGYNYSFNIIANDTAGNSNILCWNKTGLSGSYTRRYIQLNCSTTNISYNPYYFYIATYDTGDDEFKYKEDRMHHDSGPDGTTHDTGYLLDDIPTDVVYNRYCNAFIGYWFDESTCIQPFTLDSIYSHIWLSGDPEHHDDLRVGWVKTREDALVPQSDYMSIDLCLNQSEIYYDGPTEFDNYGLQCSYLDTTNTDFTDNDIYEIIFSVWRVAYATKPSIINNRSFPSFLLFNVPNNATLNASHADTDSDSLSDWEELYVTYTSPFLSDTDNDGINDYWENQAGSDPNNWTETFNVSDVPPTQSGEVPGNGSTGISLTPDLYVLCTDINIDTMNATFRSNSSGPWVDFATNTSISTGTNITQNNSNFSAYLTKYWWSVNLTDGTDWNNETYHFTTRGNNTPTFSGESPTNQSTEVSVQPTVYVIVSDADGDTITCDFYTSPDNSAWTHRQTNSGVASGTNISYSYTQASSYNTKYYWKVTANDSIADNVTSDIYEFTTETAPPVNNAPTQSGEVPINASTVISLTPQLYVLCKDDDADNMNATWWWNNSGTWYQFASNWTGFANNTNITQTNSNFSAGSTTYYWSLNLTDGMDWVNNTYHFTTLVITLTIDVNISAFSFPSVYSLNVYAYSNETEPNAVRITNNGNVAIDVQMNATDMTNLTYDKTWTLATSNGVDQYKFDISEDSWVSNHTIEKSSKTTIYPNLGIGDNITIDIRIKTPTENTSPGKMICTIFVWAIEH